MTRDSAATEAEFLANYDPRDYTPVAVTVDVAALTIRDGKLCVLVVQRDKPPFAGRWCLPGGFLRPDNGGAFSDLEAAAARRLALETGLMVDEGDARQALERVHLEQLGSYGAPGRDPRMHVVSVAYLAFAPDLPNPVAGGGTRDARWLSIDEAQDLDLAFDHAKILHDAIERARGKLEYTPLATSFLPETFTIAQLQSVYETVWGTELTTSGFRRKVHASTGFVELVPGTTGSGRGRRAQLYRAGGRSEELYPPIRRDKGASEVI